MKRIRVFELAAELRTTDREVLRLLRAHGFIARDARSRVDPIAVTWLRFEFSGVAPPEPIRPGRSKADRATPPPAPARPRVRRREEVWTDGGGGLSDRRPWIGARNAYVSLPGFRHRPTSAIPIIGKSSVDLADLDLSAVRAGLNGSPYSLPDERTEYLAASFLPRLSALAIRALRESKRSAVEERAQLRRRQRSIEIYQSNQLEGLGPDLKSTHAVLESHALTRPVGLDAAQQAIGDCLRAEPKVRHVVGLGAARILAGTFCEDPTRPITQTDIRDLHELILIGDSRRGRYKQYLNEIKDSKHVPPPPYEVPKLMGQLADWLSTTDLAPVWKAVVAHAWFTHIHPFHDGNGRVARLLSNLILIRHGFPPLIVRAGSDRGEYLNALAASDEAGDILPLAEVFRRVLNRSVLELEDPSTTDKLVLAEVNQTQQPSQERWLRLTHQLLDELAPHLLLHRLELYPVGRMNSADLRRMNEHRFESVWLAKVGVRAGARDLLLHAAVPSSLSSERLRGTAVTPSIFVSVRSGRPLDAQQYQPVGQGGFAHEFTPKLDARETFVIRNRRTLDELPMDQAAQVIAERLAKVHRDLLGSSR